MPHYCVERADVNKLVKFKFSITIGR